MSMVDPLGDMYTRIRNAGRVGKDTVDIPASNLKEEIVKVLKTEGFIDNFKILDEDHKQVIRIKLKYGEKKGKVINNIRQISKPGLRIYVNADKVPRVLGGIGVAVITTSKGVLTDRQCREQRVGGEVLCYIW